MSVKTQKRIDMFLTCGEIEYQARHLIDIPFPDDEMRDIEEEGLDLTVKYEGGVTWLLTVFTTDSILNYMERIVSYVGWVPGSLPPGVEFHEVHEVLEQSISLRFIIDNGDEYNEWCQKYYGPHELN
jgi:hypothetical protein